jgi:SAM-dependent methyltransferase
MIRMLLWDKLRSASPHGLRRWLKTRAWFGPMTQRVFGMNVYSASYFADLDRLQHESSEHIAQWIVDALLPRTIIDVGCGSGALMAALAARGVQAVGVDISPAALHMVRKRGLSVVPFDLTTRGPNLPGPPYDLVISCEVAEHLKPRHAREFVRRLTTAGNRVFLTAAEPSERTGQGPGLLHYNEQPNSYWIDLFAQHGWVLDEARTAQAREYLQSRQVIEYLSRPMIFAAPGC